MQLIWTPGFLHNGKKISKLDQILELGLSKKAAVISIFCLIWARQCHYKADTMQYWVCLVEWRPDWCRTQGRTSWPLNAVIQFSYIHTVYIIQPMLEDPPPEQVQPHLNLPPEKTVQISFLQLALIGSFSFLVARRSPDWSGDSLIQL